MARTLAIRGPPTVTAPAPRVRQGGVFIYLFIYLFYPSCCCLDCEREIDRAAFSARIRDVCSRYLQCRSTVMALTVD